jgi:hypothetical protein
MGKVGSGQLNKQPVPKYLPTSVDDLRLLMRQFIKEDDTKYQYQEPLKDNICYNLQHLEYLDFLVSDKNHYLRLTTVLKRQTIKSFVIITVGIIEGILEYLIVTRGEPATSEWKSLMKIQNTKKASWGKEYKIKNEIFEKTENGWKSVRGNISATKKQSNGKYYKIESELFVKRENAIPIEMSLDQMIKKVRSKNLLGEDSAIYDDIDKLRPLRNKVHIRIIKKQLDTDWNSFDENLLRFSKQVLSNILKKVLIFTDEPLSKEAFSYLDN